MNWWVSSYRWTVKTGCRRFRFVVFPVVCRTSLQDVTTCGQFTDYSPGIGTFTRS